MGIYFVVVAGLLGTGLAFWEISREKKSRWVVLAGGILAALGAVYVQRENDKVTDDLMAEIKGNVMFFSIAHEGRFPLRSVSASIIDHNKAAAYYERMFKTHKMIQPDDRELEDAQVAISIPEVLPVNGSYIMGHEPFPVVGNKQDFTIHFLALNGDWTEEIKMRKLADRWLSAYRVTRSDHKISFGERTA